MSVSSPIKNNILMKIKIILLAILSIVIVSCKDEINSPLEKDSPVSGNISNVSVTNLPGGAMLTYSIPSDPSFSHVLAEVSTKSGKIRQYKASNYINSLKIDGLGDTETYIVKVYAVNKSEVRSTPIDVEIKPLTPPFRTVFKTVEVV